MLSILIPANNEEAWIGPCLEALLASDDPGCPVEIIVAANACTDPTVALAREHAPAAEARGWRLEVLDIAEGGKPNALDQADAAVSDPAAIRVYLDADVTVSPGLLAETAKVLADPAPAWASGKLTVAPAKTWATRAYARVWTQLPFMTDTVPGAGYFAVNQAGRARWGNYPRIISDDTFVRLSFTGDERKGLKAPYTWPMVEGFQNLVRVRRRQDQGVEEVARLYPDLLAHDDTPPGRAKRMASLALRDPMGVAVYVAVALAVRFNKGDGTWRRGR